MNSIIILFLNFCECKKIVECFHQNNWVYEHCKKAKSVLPSVDGSVKKCTVHLWRSNNKIWFYYTVFNGKVMLEYIFVQHCVIVIEY